MENSAIFLFATIFVCFAVILGFLIYLQTMIIKSRKDTEAMNRALAESRQETAAMRRALTAPTAQGQWGELQLRRIVELAGMLDHCDYDQQVTLSGTNGGQRPDLLVRLWNGRTIVIDAKSPLDTYISAHESLDDATRTTRLRLYARRVRDHVNQLASREYWRHFEPSPEWVVLFIPNEGMFRAAVEYDSQLLDAAIQKNVLLTSPVTLLALLKAIAYGWQQEKRASNVQLIVEYSHTLQRQLKTFIIQWNRLYGQLSGTVGTFNQLTTTYQTTILPVIQQICDLDGTINTNEYDLSRIPPLQAPQPIKDLPTSIEEQLAEN